jgi:hypothetical protein
MVLYCVRMIEDLRGERDVVVVGVIDMRLSVLVL